MKKTTVALLLPVLFALTAAQAQLNDGPYVLYRADKLVVKSIEQGMMTTDVLGLQQREEVQVLVNFPGRKELDFWVQLKPEIRNASWEFRQPKKLFFVSDIEGEFEGFRRLLLANGVIDSVYNWTFGKGHLVVCGDLFDRGSQVPQCLWLLYKLEALAQKAGGEVHVILGNHDIMNLSGDLRYVQPKYMQSAKLLGLDYMELYGRDTELGSWLRSKNTIEKIGDNLCVHAGIAPQINRLGMSVREINQRCRPYYDRARLLKGVGEPDIDDFFKGETSLFWYRGYFFEPRATQAEVDQTLRLYGVNRIVVGHTIVEGNVGFYYKGKVLGLDVDGHEGVHQGALFEKGKWWKVDDRGNRTELTGSSLK